MGEPCGHARAGPGEGRAKRKRLWEIDPRLHCSIIGTCLSMGDLHRVIAKLRVTVPADAEDYNIHGYFVSGAGQAGPEIKLLQKTLERRYSAAIRRFAAVSDAADLAALWQSSLNDGDIPGPYWALVSHATAPEALIWRANGQVHMLSHLVGASNRADIRRLRALEADHDDLREQLTRAKRARAELEADCRRLIDQHAAEIRDLTDRLVVAETSQERLAVAESRIHALESGEVHRGLLARLHALTGDVDRETARANRAESGAAQAYRDLAERERTLGELDAELRALRDECQTLEALVDGGADHPGGANGPDFDLTGLRIVYVGGRTGLIPRLRDLVERSGGIFIHHDGGLEENSERLGEVLGRGDAILCPIDRVSHTACQLAKRVCKQRCKAFIPLRSSGLSSFVSGLSEISAPARANPPQGR